MNAVATHEIEERRREEQARLDSFKTAPERNKWGQFATPPELALSIARYAHSLLGGESVHFLDPAIGTGSFYSALLQVFPLDQIEGATGIELDPIFSQAAAALWGATGLRIVSGDFTQQRRPSERFNLVLTNPPYVRHHHLTASQKGSLRQQLAQSLNLELSGLAGLYCYFLLLCHDWMEDRGLAVWLIPSEFMDVNYGKTLRRYLAERVTLLHIHRFCPTDVQFTDALVSSAVVVFRKQPPPPGHAARFSFGGSIEHPQKETTAPIEALRWSHKWTQFPGGQVTSAHGELTLGDLFSIKRGLATGANSFFVLTEEHARELDLPQQFLKPILPGPRHLTGDVIEALPSGAPDVSPRLYLLDCSEPEERIRTAWPRLYEYLQQGREQNIHASYLTSRRTPWYSQEQRPPAPFLCTYMGRANNGKHPIRFLWNRSQATAHNVYLMLYPQGRLRDALNAQPEIQARIFEALKRIKPSELVSEGRVYGGGLHKVEPKELGQIPARLVVDSIDAQIRVEQQERLFV
ncbi:MAG: Eco57I restriction-modification methylase domain-containing protein [Terriglobia bacterium]